MIEEAQRVEALLATIEKFYPDEREEVAELRQAIISLTRAAFSSEARQYKKEKRHEKQKVARPHDAWGRSWRGRETPFSAWVNGR